MTKPLPRPPRHLHVFGISLLLIVGALVFFLFGVKMEATVSATGVVGSEKVVTVRAPRDGKVKHLGVGVGVGDESIVGANLPQVLIGATVDASAPLVILLGGEGKEPEMVQAPGPSPRWLILELPTADEQRVREGDPLAILVPVDPESNQVAGLGIRLDIDEKQFGAVEPGQEVRLYSNMYHHRAHGVARGTVERVEPLGKDGPNGTRKFHAWVKVTDSPFPMKLGSSVRAEIVTGRKPAYQIILEH